MDYNNHHFKYIRETQGEKIRLHTYDNMHLASFYYGIDNNGNKEEAIRVDIALEDKPAKNLKKFDVTLRIPSFNSIHSDAVNVIGCGPNNQSVTTIWWKQLGWVRGLEQFSCYTQKHKNTKTQKDVQKDTNIQTQKHTNTYKKIQTYKHTNIQTQKHTNIQTYKLTYKHTKIQNNMSGAIVLCYRGQ